MGSLGEAVLDLTADASKIDSGIDDAHKKVGAGLDTLKKNFGDATSVMLGQLSADTFNNIGQGIVSVGQDIIGGALEAEEAQAQLNAVLESTGGIAGVTADKANELANAYSALTMFDDEAILGGESLLLTFTNIGEDVFPMATETMLDMSQALGQDLKSSATQLGKALQDPIVGVTALRRVGVNFTEEQQDMIKSLVESGQVMEAQKFILKELQTEFGGSAQAAGETMAGQLKILETEFGNVKEELGTAFLPVLKDLVGMAKELMPYIQQAVGWFSNLPTPVKTGVAALGGLLAIAGPLIGAISSIVSVASALGPVLAAIAGVITGPVGIAIVAIIGLLALLYAAWTNNWGGIRDFGMKLWEDIKAGFQAFTQFLRQLWEADFGGIRSYFETVWTVITSLWNAISAAFRGDWTAFGQYLRQAWDAVWNFIVGRIQASVQNILNLAQMIVNGIRAAFQIDWGELGRRIIEGLVNALKNGAKIVADMARQVAKAALDAAKGFLGIESPSKAFMELGNFSGLGFVGGLEASLSPVRVGSAMDRVVRGAGQQINRSLQNNINVYNPSPEPASQSVDKTLRKMSYLGIVK